MCVCVCVLLSACVYVFIIYSSKGVYWIKLLFCFFLAIDCGVPEGIGNGLVDFSLGTRYNSNSVYSCLLGYRLTGDSVRSCQDNRTWSGDVPVCESEFAK